MNQNSRTHQNWYGPIPRRSSMSDGWYGPARGGYRAGSERIPAKAWAAVAVVAVVIGAFLKIAAVTGF